MIRGFTYGAQISYSFVGHHADITLKKEFDPGGSKRREVLASHPPPVGIEVRVGGTTCLDYFPYGLNKGFNVRKYASLRGWPMRECIYVGDALFPGGNDESVIGVMPTFPVQDPEETYGFLTTL